jgi:hypothetical protein
VVALLPGRLLKLRLAPVPVVLKFITFGFTV